MRAEPRAFAAGERPVIRGEVAGEGPPIVLCHGMTATRRYVVHGSRALERAGHAVVTYDARGHGESDPAPPGQGYGYPEQVADLEEVVASGLGDGRFVLGGHSMGAHTAVAYALRHPERLAGIVVIGPTYVGEPASEETLAYWNDLATALERGGVDAFVDYIDRNQPVDSGKRDAVRRFTRERIARNENLGAIAEVLRQVPGARPFGSLEELESIAVPALVVASDDGADPGHPRHVAEAYAERMPRAKLIVEAKGESPLAWQGGKLSREIAAFCAGLGA
ncbi:MAG TPA: alpha/beta hydrolase [Solirubrobacterales bacterium]|nr:alpha/beta hydrolase [Solirubrobacterales bacterium]